MLISKLKSSKLLKHGFKKFAGRNAKGRITERHQGGGHKRLYRFIDFKQNNNSQGGLVTSIDYDPNRSAYLATICNKKTLTTKHIICPQNIEILQEIKFLNESFLENKDSSSFIFKNGDRTILKNLTIGDFIYNIEGRPGQGGLYARSAGTYGQLIQKVTNRENYGVVKLPSGQQYTLNLNCAVSYGKVSNETFADSIIGKAGRSRWLNKRPTVRGVAMNAVDHPHGGGRGKTAGGGPTKTPWGWPAKGVSTKNKKKRK